MTDQNRKKTIKTIAVLGILIALTLVMAFTPVGYLKVGAVSISFLMIPVAVGAIAVGPWAGALLGAVFGITSFVQCFGADPFGFVLQKSAGNVRRSASGDRREPSEKRAQFHYPELPG